MFGFNFHTEQHAHIHYTCSIAQKFSHAFQFTKIKSIQKKNSCTVRSTTRNPAIDRIIIVVSTLNFADIKQTSKV